MSSALPAGLPAYLQTSSLKSPGLYSAKKSYTAINHLQRLLPSPSSDCVVHHSMLQLGSNDPAARTILVYACRVYPRIIYQTALVMDYCCECSAYVKPAHPSCKLHVGVRGHPMHWGWQLFVIITNWFFIVSACTPPFTLPAFNALEGFQAALLLLLLLVRPCIQYCHPESA